MEFKDMKQESWIRITNKSSVLIVSRAIVTQEIAEGRIKILI